MPTAEEKLKALIMRMEEVRHWLQRIIELGKAVETGRVPAEMIPYIKDDYYTLKAALVTCLSRVEEPATGELPSDVVIQVLGQAHEVDRSLGAANEWAKKLLYGSSGHPQALSPTTWTEEQRQQLKLKIEELVQRAKDALSQMP